ncbi:MAG: NADH-quinone oxidoreductase subunit L [Ignavibacteriales bacterium]|nr:NADH-quinone oxidoreductase subunit L [Ignavibacteriales bacterium]
MITFAPLLVLFPLLGFLFNGVFGWKIKNEKLLGIVGSGSVGLSFILASVIFVQMLGVEESARKQSVEVFTWVSTFTGSSSSFSASVAYQIDQLSILMALIVTGVGFLIHVYSIGYMRGDPGFWRFFAYLNLFIFAMLNLVLADNFLLMFLGWEGVGLCSYLLIGFWYDRKFDIGGEEAGSTYTGHAGMKAFIVNRIGDFGFLMGMLLIFVTFGSLRYDSVFSNATIMSVGTPVLTWITLFLFVGATGKSAQIPLHVWLPDAMAGPTPVSALIHAATMVTAGVYMVARCSILFALAPTSMLVVAIIGALTAFCAATIGLVQNDIKKVLAYSTVSQLGYMFLAMGVAAFSAGIFHLMTHAFFKALLFLGSGAVIHAMHEEQDIQKMGGLKKYLPITHKTFVAGALALAGFPLLSGFFSKDEILWNAFIGEHGSPLLWLIGATAAAFTAFYSFRLVTLTFDGKERFDHHHLHPHEAPATMYVPLVILAVLSVVGGLVGIPHVSQLEHWLDPVFDPAKIKLMQTEHEGFGLELLFMVVSGTIALAGIWAARKVYLERPEVAEQYASRFKKLYRLLWNKYFVDEGYNAVAVRPIVKGSDFLLWKGFDVAVIDGALDGSAAFVNKIASVLRKIQTGVAQSYATAIVGGILFVLTWIVLR